MIFEFIYFVFPLSHNTKERNERMKEKENYYRNVLVKSKRTRKKISH